MIGPQHHHRGFTVIEVTIVSGLMAFLALLLSNAWVGGIGKTTIDLVARAQLAQEMDIATMALGRDLGGCPTNTNGQLTATFPTWDNDSPPDPNKLRIVSDDGVTVTFVTYYLDTANLDPLQRNNLVRHDSATGQTFTVARNVDAFQPTLSVDKKTLTIRIDFSCNYPPANPPPSAARDYSIVKRTCVLVVNQPPQS